MSRIRIWLILSVLLSLGGALEAQERSVTARVVDASSGEGLPQARIVLPDGRVVLTGAGGRFTLSYSAAAGTAITVRRLGYRSTTVRWSDLSGDGRVIRLVPLQLVELDPISVTATRVATPLTGIPAAVSVIGSDEIRTLVPHDLDDLLNSLPNVTTTGGPRAEAQLPAIRGLSGDRVTVRLDGARQNFISGHKGRIFIDPTLLKKVEVLRGTPSALYGSGLGGVISLETKSALDLLEPGERAGISLAPRLGTESDEFSGTFAGFGKSGAFDLLAAVSAVNTDDVRLGDGSHLRYSGAETTDILAKVGASPARNQRLELSFERYDRQGRTPINANTIATDSGSIADKTSGRTNVRIHYRFQPPHADLLGLNVTAYRNKINVREVRLTDARVEDREVVTWGTEVANTSRLALGPAVAATVTTGFEFFRDENTGARNGAPLGSFPDSRADFLGLYVQNELRILDRITLVPGLRGEIYRYSSASRPRRTEQELQFRFAARFDLTRFANVYGSYAEGFNAPRAQELYISGLHFPGPPGSGIPDNFFVANPDLGPERSRTYEGGLRLAAGDLLVKDDGLRAEFTVFRTDARDFIARDVDVFGGRTVFQNLESVKLTGFEGIVGYSTRIAYGRISYGRVREDDLTADTPVDDAPADNWILELGARLLNGRLDLGYRGRITERQDRVSDPSDTLLVTPGYFVNDLFISLSPELKQLPGLALTVRANNVFDKAYRPHGTVILAPGRDLRVEVRYRLGVR